MLNVKLSPKSQMTLKVVSSRLENVNQPLTKFAFKMYQETKGRGYMPEVSGDLKNNKLISVTGNNQVTVTQLMPYANRRYTENKKNPSQKEWFDNYLEQHWDDMENFFIEELIKEL